MLTTSALAGFTSCLTFADLPPDVVNRTRLLVLDCVGNMVRARRDSESTPALLAAARFGSHQIKKPDTNRIGGTSPAAPSKMRDPIPPHSP